LEVQDSGRGFDPAAQQGAGPGERIGLSGMRERVALLGGQCEVRSRPGAGTRVVAVVPLRPPAGSVEAALAGSQ
jgi:signal transduction histidine kinase